MSSHKEDLDSLNNNDIPQFENPLSWILDPTNPNRSSEHNDSWSHNFAVLHAPTLTGLTVSQDRFIWSRCRCGYGMQSPNWTRYVTQTAVAGNCFYANQILVFVICCLSITQRKEDAALISSFKRGSTLISRLFNLIKKKELDLSHQ